MGETMSAIAYERWANLTIPDPNLTTRPPELRAHLVYDSAWGGE